MESNASCCLLGQPIDQISSSGCLICTVTQLFAQVVIDVPAAVVAQWSDHKFKKNGTVEFDGNKAFIWGQKGVLSLQAHTWGDINSEECTWKLGRDGALTVTLEKNQNHWGSWPRPLQSLTAVAAHPGGNHDASLTLQQVCMHDKEAFNKAADEALEAHLEETRALRVAFSQAVSQQLSSAAYGPLGQLAILFPAQGPHCLSFLQRAQHLSSVQRLVSIAEERIGFDFKSVAHPPDTVLGPADALVVCFLAGLAALEHRRAEHGISSMQCITSVCGWGGGEYAAAVFAGALRLTDALRLVGAHADALLAGAGPAVAAAAVRRILDDIEILPTRLRMYSGADAGLYSTPDDIRLSLPRRAACCASRPLSNQRLRLVRLALMQQGVAQFIEPVPVETKEGIRRTPGSNASELGSVEEEGDGFF